MLALKLFGGTGTGGGVISPPFAGGRMGHVEGRASAGDNKD